MTFSDLIDDRALTVPDGAAVSDASRALSNSELLDRIRGAATHLASLGVGAGDVVAVKLTNRIEYVVLLFAAWRLGAAVTPVNPAMTRAEVARQLADSRAHLLVVEDGDTYEGHVPVLSVGELATGADADGATRVVDPSSLALLIYTSGTTGVPKGVMLDHANLTAMTTMGRDALEVGSEDRCLLILPLFHVNGIVVSVLLPLLVGGSVVIADRFNPTTFFDVVARERPTFFSAVPTIYGMLAALPDDVRPDTSSVRFAVCGAAPAAPDLLQRFEDRYGFPLVEAYGLSEGTCGSATNPINGVRKPGTVGLPFPGQEIRIIDPDGEQVAQGGTGEVVIRGANVMRGYLGRPDDTAATIVDGWLRTGDLGRLDEDGYLSIVGRSKEMIIRGGENIYPKEIEDVIASHPGVLEVAVIGVPDEKWGEVVVAYVQPRPGAALDARDLTDLCSTRLSGYKRPTAIHLLDALPKSAVGKLDKRALLQESGRPGCA